MNKWLDEELAELKQAKKDKAAKAARSKLLEQHTKALWKELKTLLEDAVKKISVTPELRKMTGRLMYESGSADKIEIKKPGSPAIVLTLTRKPESIYAHYVWLKSIRSKSGSPSWKTLYVALDEDGRPFFKDLSKGLGEDGSLTLEEATRQILRPFLHPELVE